jgi:peroxiredoxin
MKRFRSTVSLLALTIACAALAGLAPADDAKAEVGKAAPSFTLKDTAGKEHKLSDFKGKMVVLEWINPDCPVCRDVFSRDVVENTIKEVRKISPDAVYLMINSTHYMDAAGSAAYMSKHDLDVPALVDQDGTVGKLYGARTTPHVFVIDDKGVLRYQGAIDNDQRGRKAKRGEDVTNYVVNAARQIKAGDTVSPSETQPYGCSVKYKR